ncbi:hypothetical protein ACFPN2_20955 [Steroidobacter flavus]|uniref:Uncharacterized protein n=1 Tax=Steroidobacter flavus TaxID=1842136 RepID=A0ABV8SX31_9GAMM
MNIPLHLRHRLTEAIAGRNGMTKRIEFSAKTKEAIAKRAGYRCSFLGCDRLTVGPDIDPRRFEVSGVACHIYSASQAGPRGWGSLAPQDIAATSNGIWMCAHHAGLIDKNAGAAYSPTLLAAWKADREQRTAREHNGLVLQQGWIKRLTVRQSPIFDDNCTLEFGKVTLIVGSIGSGKTALCDWISTLATCKHLSRWQKHGKPLHFDVAFSNPADHTLSVQLNSACPEIRVDDVIHSLGPIPFAMMYVNEHFRRSAGNEMQLLCNLLDLDPRSVRALTARICESPVGILAAAEWTCAGSGDNHDGSTLMCTLHRGESYVRVPFRSGALSGGERTAILLEFVIARLQLAARLAPAVLLVEYGALCMDAVRLRYYVNFLASPRSSFQTIMTAPMYWAAELVHKSNLLCYRLDDSIDRGHRISRWDFGPSLPPN